MLSWKTLKPYLVALAIVVVSEVLFGGSALLSESFGGRSCTRCPGTGYSNKMCHHIASDNCQIPQPMLNDCWLNAYRRCANACGDRSSALCDCHHQASIECDGKRCDDPALACYASVHQKCMASQGHAVDPDRGGGACTGDACNWL